MYKVYLTDQPAGFPIELDNFLKFQQDGYNTPMEAIAKGFGDKVIIDGVTESGYPIVTVAPGFAVVNKELVYFEGGAKQATFYLTTDIATLIYQGDVAKEVLQTRIARFGAAAELQFNYADLRRLQPDANTGLLDRVLKLEKILKPLLPYTDPGNPLNTVYGSWLFWGRPAGEIPTGWEAVDDASWKGKIPILYNEADADFNAVGNTGGEKTHLLTIAEMPAHTHPGTHGVEGNRDTANNGLMPRNDGGGSDGTFSVASQGGGTAHNNMPPYKVVMFIRFVG